MKNQKAKLGKIKDLLSRDEMKKVVAGGSGDCTIWCCITDNSGTHCRYVCTVWGCW